MKEASSNLHEERPLFEPHGWRFLRCPKSAWLYQFPRTLVKNTVFEARQMLELVFCVPAPIEGIELSWKSKSLWHSVVDCESFLVKKKKNECIDISSPSNTWCEKSMHKKTTAFFLVWFPRNHSFYWSLLKTNQNKGPFIKDVINHGEEGVYQKINKPTT